MLIYGQIVHVYLVKSLVVLDFRLLETVEFNDYFHAKPYAVHGATQSHVFVLPTDLCDHHVYRLYSQPIPRTNHFADTDVKFIVMKYNIYNIKFYLYL